MEPSFDLQDIVGFDVKLARMGSEFTPALMGRSLRQALKPVLTIAQREVPTGPAPTYTSNTVRRGRNKGFARITSGYYARGGATRNSMRILIVPGQNEEVTRGLVGVSKRKGSVGWRTHLITRANKHRHVADDFLLRTEREGVPLVVQSLGEDARKTIENVLLRNG